MRWRRQGYADDGPGRGRSRPAQHLPHPREGGREGLFRARPHARHEGGARKRRRPRDDDRRRRLRRAGRGRGDHRAARPPSTSSSARRPITACPSCSREARAASSVVETEFPVEDKFEHLPPPSAPIAQARRHGLPHRAGRLRQVLHLLRRALYARRGSLAPGRADRRRGGAAGRAGVREITLLGQNVNAYHGEGRTVRTGRLAACSTAWPKSRAWSGCATPPAIRATWTTS